MNHRLPGRSFGKVVGKAPVFGLLLGAALAAGLTACTSRSAAPARSTQVQPARHAASARRLAALVGCLTRVGADAIDVSRTADLRVSGGEAAVAFSTFDAYVGFASGPVEARRAAAQLDQDLTLTGQPGQATISGDAVFYYDASLVPAAAGRLVTACARGAEGQALLAMASLSDGLPRIEFPPKLASAFTAACRRLGSAGGCACAYGRATRLYRYGQISDLGSRPRVARLAALLRMCAGEPTAVRGTA